MLVKLTVQRQQLADMHVYLCYCNPCSDSFFMCWVTRYLVYAVCSCTTCSATATPVVTENPNHIALLVRHCYVHSSQAQLQERLQHGINNSSSSASSVQQQTQGKAKKPAWGIFSSSKHKQQDASEVQQQQPEKVCWHCELHVLVAQQ